MEAQEQPVQLPAPIEPAMALVEKAIAQGIKPDELGKLLDLARQWRADRAAEAFANAITAFQAEMPPVRKNRQAQGGKMQFAYASLDDVMRVAGPILARNRIVVTFDTSPQTVGIEVVCRVRVGTHFETSAVVLPVPAGIVNDTQLMGQAVSYGRRYALCAALNIVVTDEDQDASGLNAYLDHDQLAWVDQMLGITRIPLGAFLEWLEAKTLDQIRAADWLKAADHLRREAGKLKKTFPPPPGAKNGGPKS